MTNFKDYITKLSEASTMSHQGKTTLKGIKNPDVTQRMAAHDIKPGVKGYADRAALIRDAEAKGKIKEELETGTMSEDMGYANESVELEELSKTTLGSYVKKASRSAATNAAKNVNSRIAAMHSKGSEEEAHMDASFDAHEKKVQRLKGIDKAVGKMTKESETGTMRFKDFIAERADREDDEHGGGPTPAQNPDKGWKPGKSKVTKVVKEDEVNENEEKVKAHNKAVAGGYQVARKKMSQGDPAVLKKAPKGYSFDVAHKLYPVKESVFDWKKNKSEVNWKDDKDEPSTSKEGGTVYKARDHARDAANEPKKAVGRPAGEYKGNYKPRAASSKKDSLAKSMASKAEGFKDRDEWKKQMHTAIMKKQLQSAGLNPDDHKDAIAKKLGK